MANLLPVAFHGDTLYLVEHNGEPFTPIRPICEAIGVAWQPQQRSIERAQFGHPARQVVEFLRSPRGRSGCNRQRFCTARDAGRRRGG